jgi:DNA-binding response OmpR family regulator
MKRVLLLEEDREGREVLGKILKKRGFSVVQAGNAATALASVSSAMPLDLVIAGITDTDRTTFLSDLRDENPDLPVIFLSDYCAPEARLRGVLYGAFLMSRALHFYINTRPIGLQELIRMIRIVLQQRNVGVERSLAA